MNNYNLTSIQEENGLCMLQASFYRLPVHATKEPIEEMIENNLNKKVNIIECGDL